MLETLYRTSTLGERLRIFRAAHKLSLRDLEKLSGVDKSTISRAENDKEILASNLIRLAKAMNLSMDELVEGAVLGDMPNLEAAELADKAL